MNWTNYHSHTHYCDGTTHPEAYIKEAIQKGVKIYGFSSHCPVPFKNGWSIKKINLPYYLQEIDQLKTKYQNQLEIYKSMEIDYIPGVISVDSDIILKSQLDYTLSSVHFVGQFENGDWWEIDGTISRFKQGLLKIYQNNIQKVVQDYYSNIRKMVTDACPDIVGHLDKIKMHNVKDYFFDENEKWYQEEVQKTLEVIRSSPAIVEVNTRGMYKKYCDEPYPGKTILQKIFEMNIPVTINSDCHHPSEIISNFSETAELLLSIGFKKVRILKDRKWIDVDFDVKGLYF